MLQKVKIVTYTCFMAFVVSCSSNKKDPGEEIRITQPTISAVDTASVNSIEGNVSFDKILSQPNRIVLTGLPQHRLVTVYKTKKAEAERDSYGYKTYYETDSDDEHYQHFMPGIDLIYGYNLLNIAHYDLTAEKLNYLFDHPVLIKSLYYPSYEQDSINDKPINRDYYLVSVYDEDTYLDTLLNQRDLRHMYYFNAQAGEKLQLIPSDYSVERSQYDWKNDLMYIFARHDANKNGNADKKEPLHIFWIDLKKPAPAKRLY
jgi:hypothetical protein